MNFIIGGAYQGKHELAQKKFGITDDEVFICTYNPENDPKNRDGAEKNSTAEGIDFSRPSVEPCLSKRIRFISVFAPIRRKHV